MFTVEDLVGTWSLVAYDVLFNDSSDRIFPMGANATGRLTYGQDGSVWVIFMSENLAKDASIFKSKTLYDAFADTFASYWGTFDVEGDRVVHHVSLASTSQMLNTDQERDLSWENGNLVLGARGHLAGREGVARVVWRRGF